MVRPTDWNILDLQHDPTPGDPFRIKDLGSRIQTLGDEAELAARDVRGLAGDPAAMNWIGASGDAFRDSIGKFPGQLEKVAASHHMCAAALIDFGNALDSCQSQADRALSQARPLHDQAQRIQQQLSAAHGDLTSANKGVDAAQAAATLDPDSVHSAVRAQSDAQHAVSTLNNQMSGTSAQLDALKKLAASAESLRHTAEDTARTKINAATDAGIPPDSFWHKVGEIAKVVWKGLVIVAGIVSFVGGIILLVVGGPLWLIVAVVVAGVILLADKIVDYAEGKAKWWEVALAVLACIPITKGLTSLTAIAEAFRAGGFLGVGAHFLGVGLGAVKGIFMGVAGLIKGGAGRIVRIFSDGSRGVEAANNITHDAATWQALDAAYANSAPRIPSDPAAWEFMDRAWANSAPVTDVAHAAAPGADAAHVPGGEPFGYVPHSGGGVSGAADAAHAAAPASDASHAAARASDASHVAAPASDASHAAAPASDASHAAAPASDASHAAVPASDASHAAAPTADASHAAAPASDASHAAAPAADGSHTAAPASDASHVAAPASDASHVAAPASDAAHAPGSDPFGTVTHGASDAAHASAPAADASHAAAPAADAAHAPGSDPFGTVTHGAADASHAAAPASDAAHAPGSDPFGTVTHGASDAAHAAAPASDAAHAPGSDPFGTVTHGAADASHAAAPASDAAHAPGSDPFGTVTHTAPAADVAHVAPVHIAPPEPMHIAPPEPVHTTPPEPVHIEPAADPVHVAPGIDAAHEAALDNFAQKYYGYAEDLDYCQKIVAEDPAFHGMDPRELAATRGYTSSEFYKQLNAALRGDNPALLAQYADHEAAINAGLSQMPQFEGQVIRVMPGISPASAADVAAQYVPGTTVVEHAFTSASGVAGGLDPSSLIQMTIQSKTGVDITALSRHGHELEVLFKTGTEFEVLERTKGPGGIWNIVLQEK